MLDRLQLRTLLDGERSDGVPGDVAKEHVREEFVVVAQVFLQGRS